MTGTPWEEDVSFLSNDNKDGGGLPSLPGVQVKAAKEKWGRKGRVGSALNPLS